MSAFHLPYRWKYVEKDVRFRQWFVFGVNKTTGNVDISDGEDDVFVDVPEDAAIRILAARHTFLTTLEAINSEL